MFPYENVASNHGGGLDSLASLGAVGGGAGGVQTMENNANKKVNEESGNGASSSGSQKPQNVVAVPKNIQRNIISRERDDRRKVRRAEKPRNMMNEVMVVDVNHVSSFNEAAGNDLNNVVVGANGVVGGGVQSEMAEADQLQMPGDGSIDPSAFDIQPLEIGLDRVPTRLSSSELEARRQEEEDNLQNIVDEVLNSSSEADFVHGADQPPSPR